MSNIQYIWEDRQRFMGMPLTDVRYAMSEDRLFRSQGLLTIRDEEVQLYRVRDIQTSRSLWQRIFGVGTITVISSDKSAPTLLLKNVKAPLDVKEKLHAQVEKMKALRRSQLGNVIPMGLDEDEMDDKM